MTSSTRAGWASGVDYRATSQRPAWPKLPEPVRAAVAAVVGAPVTPTGPAVASGFSGGYAGVLATSRGSQLFVKADGPHHPFVVAALEQEAQVLAQLPPGIPAPRLVGFTSVDGWSVLVLEAVEGRLPGLPWTPADVTAVHDACLTIAELGTPWTVGESDLTGRMAGNPDVAGLARALVAGTSPPLSGLPPWLTDHQAELGELVLGPATRLTGETLSHGDLRPDNLLVRPDGRAVVVDWNWVGPGPAWVDWVGLLPLMAWQGVDTAALVATSPLTRDTDPEDIDAFLACIVVYMLDGRDRPPPDGCTPALRRHQALMATAFLQLLGARRGWAAG